MSALQALIEKRAKTLEKSQTPPGEIEDEEDEIRVQTRKAEARLKKLQTENFANAFLEKVKELEKTYIKNNYGCTNFEVTLNQITKLKDFTSGYI